MVGSSAQPIARASQFRRRDPERLGRRDQIGLMCTQKIEHRAQNTRIAQPGAQIIGGQTGQRQQPPGAVLVAQQPAERTQSQRLRIGSGGFGFAENCQPRV